MSISPRAAQTKWLSHLTHNSHLNANSTNEYLYSGGLLFEPFRDVEEIPFPRLTVIWRKSLAPYGAFFVPRIPAENDEDGFAIERVFAKKWPTPLWLNEPTTGGSIFPMLLAIQ
jgi:hypothetical protein